ncbi:hypothetical protein [Ascidiimonas aurantiaca]|uniref:hypothetical protein n=1 Tax=Ascidiimonas aurantiaca TaxID=1685432 RepID=UPI0030EE1D76
MGNEDENSFSKGLGIIVAIVGAFMGVGIANEDPELNAFAGFLIGGFIGYIVGRIVGEIVSMVIQVIIAILSIVFILFRVYRFFSLLGE